MQGKTYRATQAAHSHRREHIKGLFLLPLLADQYEGLLVENKCVYILIHIMGVSSSWTWHSVYLVASPGIFSHWCLHIKAVPAAVPLQLLAQLPLHTHNHTYKCSPTHIQMFTPTHTSPPCMLWVSPVPAHVTHPWPHGRADTQPSHTHAHGTGNCHPGKPSKIECKWGDRRGCTGWHRHSQARGLICPFSHPTSLFYPFSRYFPTLIPPQTTLTYPFLVFIPHNKCPIMTQSAPLETECFFTNTTGCTQNHCDTMCIPQPAQYVSNS